MTPGNTTLTTAEETSTSFLAHWHASPAAAILLLVPAVLAAGCLLWQRVRKLGDGRRRGTAAVRVTAVAAFVCTALSASTSWRFAADYLGMHNAVERIAVFAAGELGMLANAAMAHKNLHGPRHAAGLPAAMLWMLAAVLSIPAYAEFGLVGGTWSAFFGPVMAAALWSLAAGIDERHRTPGSASRAMAAASCRDTCERPLDRAGPVEQSPKTGGGSAATPPSAGSPSPTGPDRPA
ncbi:hypothetical protein [Streptomyces sp. NPDC058603]|uniref:hypothetical protein n=1 Tax=Streptomyces sp. NPDC058603 TaxID=3346551 RepID=UPI00364CAAF0